MLEESGYVEKDIFAASETWVPEQMLMCAWHTPSPKTLLKKAFLTLIKECIDKLKLEVSSENETALICRVADYKVLFSAIT
jgi:hypothetical protein